MTDKTDAASDWFALGIDTWQLVGDAAAVIWLRSARLAAGGAQGEREARLMVAEKVAASASLGRKLASGKGGHTPEALARTTVAHYGRRVRANRRRLSK